LNGARPAQVALAWLLAQKPGIVPLFGTRKLERFEENIGALSVTLTKEDLDEVEAADIKIEGCRSPKRHQAESNRLIPVSTLILGGMFALMGSLLRLLVSPANLRDIALENLVLRQQPAVFKRKCPGLGCEGRIASFGCGCPGVEGLAPDAGHRKARDVVAWHRQGFRLFWSRISRRKSGRPEASPVIRALILKMAAANPLWGAPRIHGELLKLGMEVSERTVSRLMPKYRKRPSRLGRLS
jgi:Aldo/keto reductase family